jgi:hypothetical protein
MSTIPKANEEAEEYLEKLRISSSSIDPKRDRERRMGFIAGYQLATDGREELEKTLAYIKDTLGDCREYMDDKADVDVDNDYFVPNKEAKLLSRIDSTIELLNKHYERK